MTGPEHYKRAERLLHMATEEGVSWRVHRNRVRMAGVHATLALAAATAGPAARRADFADFADDYETWKNAIGGASDAG